MPRPNDRSHVRAVPADDPRPDRPPARHARRVASAIGAAGGTIGSVDLSRWPAATRCATSSSTRPASSTATQVIAAIDGVDGASVIDTTDRTLLMHVGGKIEQRNKPAQDPRRPFDGLHARRGARLPGDRRRPRQGVPVHDQAQHGRRGLRRLRRARPRRHRPRGGDAGDGGQGMLFKEFAGVDAFPICPVHQGPRRDRRDRHRDRARLRWHQPRGHLGPALLRDRGAPKDTSTSRSSTTTSTAPRWWCSPRCSTPPSSPASASPTSTCSSSASARPAWRCRRSCSRRACAT